MNEEYNRLMQEHRDRINAMSEEEFYELHPMDEVEEDFSDWLGEQA